MRSLGKLSPITLAIQQHKTKAYKASWLAACLAISSSVVAGVQTPENTKSIGTSPSQDFSFFDVSGELYDAAGSLITSSFEFFGFSDEMEGNWTGNWFKRITGGWRLNLSFVGDNIDIYDDLRASAGLPGGPTQVSAPSSLLLIFSGLLFLVLRRRANKKSNF